MSKITFIIGGARSGKSAFALEMAGKARKAAFIATCEPKDSEMSRRIAAHKKNRPKHWKTFEEPLNPEVLLEKISAGFDYVVIDCLTLLVSNMMIGGLKEAVIEDKIRKLLTILRRIKASSAVVSNEVGFGVVPENRLARKFRDIAGRMNQIVAEESDGVFFTVSGIPWRIK